MLYMGRFTPPPNRDAEGPLSVHAYLYILDRFIIDTYEHSVTFSMVLCTVSASSWELLNGYLFVT